MAKRPEPDKNAVLCTTCDKQVVKNDKKEWQHVNTRVRSHDVIRVIKYSDWAAKYNADRTIRDKDGVAVKGPNVKPAKTTTKAAAKPVVKRKTDVEKAAIRAQNEADRAKVAAELQERQDKMEEAWSKKRGYHIPLVTSREPVVRPSTGEIYRPSTGEVIHQMDPSGLPPKLGTPERSSLEAGIDHVHEDHPWQAVLGEDGTLATSPVIDSSRQMRNRNHFGGMTNWAHMLKRKRDPNNEKEFKVWRAEPVPSGDYRGLPYGLKDINRTSRYQWKISSRDRYCEKCAPTITLPTGSVKPNPVKSVNRPPMEELGNITSPDNTTMEDRMQLDIANAGGGTGRTRQRKPLEEWQKSFIMDKPPE
jgi:hypothetical protein